MITFDHEHVPDRAAARPRGVRASPSGPGPTPSCTPRTRSSCATGSAPRASRAPPTAWSPTPTRCAPSATRSAGRSSPRPRAAATTARACGRSTPPSRPRSRSPRSAGSRAGAEILAEEYVDFARELSALVVRSPSGQAVAYPVSESVQRDGICVETTTPAPGLSEEQAVAAEALALQVAGELGVVGVLAVELMERRDGTVVVNELAMRPHNTGPLEHRRRAHLAVREPPARRPRPAARRPGHPRPRGP